MREDIIKKLIILFIICVIIIICLIVGLIKNSNKDTKDEELSDELEHVEEPIENPEQAFQPIADKSYYFCIKRIINNLDSYIEQINGDWPVNSNSEVEFERTEQGIKNNGITNLKNILDKEYLDEFAKTEQGLYNIFSRFKSIKESSPYTGYTRIIDNIYEADVDYTKILFLVNSRLNGVESKILIKLDIENYVYSILLDDYIEKYSFSSAMKKDSIKIFNNTINKNDDNSVIFDTVSDEKMCLEYFDIYKNICKNDNQKVYSLLDEKYRNKRFNNYDNFKSWIDDIKNQIDDIKITKYSDNYLDDGTLQYRILDNNDNIYTFRIKNNSILDYRIQLDDYTIPSQEFKEKYNNSDDKGKVLANIQTFFKMLNNRDYYSAYNILDDNFKANNFKTLDEFKQYAQTHFFEKNILKTSENFKKVGTYYSATITYAESSDDDARDLQKTFIVGLGQDTEFKLSFNK